MTVPTSIQHSSPQPCTQTRLALETFYDILEYIDCKRELVKLARTSRVLQRAAECRLYRTVAIHGERDLHHFSALLSSANTSRIGEMVRKFTFHEEGEGGGGEGVCAGVERVLEDVLGNLLTLDELNLRMDASVKCRGFTPETLLALRSSKLSSLRCTFDVDTQFINFLTEQPFVQILDLEISSERCSLLSDRNKATIRRKDESSLLSDFHSSVLPNLRAIRTSSHAIALALIPGRPVSHIWITEAGLFTSTPSFLRRSVAGTFRAAIIPQTRSTSLEDDTTSRETHESDLFHEYATVLPFKTRFGTEARSVRLEFHAIPQVVVLDVLKDFAKYLGSTIRTLGFLNKAAVDELSNWKEKVDDGIFKFLHTIALDYTPSRAAVDRFAKSPALPALRTIACYDFSPSFEYLCVPVNDLDVPTNERGYDCKDDRLDRADVFRRVDFSSWNCHTGGIKWVTDMEGRRRPTPVHDPDYNLWLDA